MSEQLKKARAYEEETEKQISPKHRPMFHLSARVGWMNDPNGFSWYDGMYHLFYQYHPYDSQWGPMHWGHAVSTDLLHWEYRPCAMAPDEVWDHDGCFSGSAATADDGSHVLMYTGLINSPGAEGDIPFIQTQNLAFGDGTDYTKYVQNPVIDGSKLPQGGSLSDFRDPRIWRAEDGTWRAIIANNHIGHGGWFLLYRSDDLLHWEYMHVMAENENRIGLMWECPDFFELDGEYVVLGSAQDMLPEGFEYHNGMGTFYMTGTYDPETEQFTEEENHSIDYGIDFYAPQTILAPDGRRIMIGWMQNWDTANLFVRSRPWFGQMSVPRELSLKDGILYQLPVRELEQYRVSPVLRREVRLADGDLRINGIRGRTADLTVEVRAANPETMYQRFAVRFAQNEKWRTGVSFRPHESTLKIDRKFSGSRRAVINQRRALVNHDRGSLKLRLIIDRFSIEVFVNDGEKVMSAVIDTELNADGFSFFADGDIIMNISFYQLKL